MSLARVVWTDSLLFIGALAREHRCSILQSGSFVLHEAITTNDSLVCHGALSQLDSLCS
jgi:hypothetical protein